MKNYLLLIGGVCIAGLGFFGLVKNKGSKTNSPAPANSEVPSFQPKKTNQPESELTGVKND